MVLGLGKKYVVVPLKKNISKTITIKKKKTKKKVKSQFKELPTTGVTKKVALDYNPNYKINNCESIFIAINGKPRGAGGGG